ncbi:Gfo/Idh/MocA family oxidoreductase [Paenibacillus sp. N4]|uniref:Gfo/Idh/MocA family protein n=1 Tax=Paenibacillus vietnamensis TaxID=2590547 RepID=UPI001CD0B2CB|nr:Gfo/Idh/MocA family oxidoreductase [Paenibacillus vietnamensis]MCA0754275.1 Gfo/Idh/MocA family oxidoreductase [Paenibacillus vietnamensis]
MKPLNLGIIGADSSHAVAFTKLLNDSMQPYHVNGGHVTIVYPGGSPDFPLSRQRVAGFTGELVRSFGVRIASTPAEVAEASDAILLLAADGRKHKELFERIAAYGKPVFIDKPFALSSADAMEMKRMAEACGIPLMSCSSLRYAQSLTEELAKGTQSDIAGAHVYGPISVEPTQGYYFWYGIHSAELLYAIMGPGCLSVTVESSETMEWIKGRWHDGRIGTIRLSRSGSYRFGALIHRKTESVHVDTESSPKPFYSSLLENVIGWFGTRKPALDLNETIEIIRFLEAADESRMKGEIEL